VFYKISFRRSDISRVSNLYMGKKYIGRHSINLNLFAPLNAIPAAIIPVQYHVNQLGKARIHEVELKADQNNNLQSKLTTDIKSIHDIALELEEEILEKLIHEATSETIQNEIESLVYYRCVEYITSESLEPILDYVLSELVLDDIYMFIFESKAASIFDDLVEEVLRETLMELTGAELNCRMLIERPRKAKSKLVTSRMDEIVDYILVHLLCEQPEDIDGEILEDIIAQVLIQKY
jgi:hypothetical protein